MYAQEIVTTQGLRISTGFASQKLLPGASNDYRYESKTIAVAYLKQLWKLQKWQINLEVAPTINAIQHRLRNAFFINPDDGDFKARRERFLAPRKFIEYTLHLGLRIRYPIVQKTTIIIFGSTGPMFGTAQTERLKKGFAFSNTAGVGISYDLSNTWSWDVSAAIRHTSNANLDRPNSGHNSFGFQTGFIYHW